MVRFFVVALLCLSFSTSSEPQDAPWRWLFSESSLNALSARFGEAGRQRTERLKRFLDTELQIERDIGARLEQINRFFNDFDFIDDQHHWGKRDYWATPLELVASGGGDCEDFSIAKSFALWALGVDSDKLRLMYAKSISLEQAHMVLLYLSRPDAMPLVLDNIERRILPGDQRPDLIPVYSFNGAGLWRSQGFIRHEQLLEGDSGVNLWRDLVERMAAQGSGEGS